MNAKLVPSAPNKTGRILDDLRAHIHGLETQLAAVTAERDRAAAIIDEQARVIQHMQDSRDVLQLSFQFVQLDFTARIS